MRRRYTLTSLLFMLSVGCSDVGDQSAGRLTIKASGGNEARDGIEKARFADGFAVRYDHVILSVSAIELGTSDGDKAEVDAPPTVVDLVPSSAEVHTLSGLSAQRWDQVGFRSHPVKPGVRNVNAPPELVERMITDGFSFLQTGTLTSPEGKVIPFELGFPVEIDYFRCTAGDGTYGVVVPVNGTAEAEITWHLTHLWFDSFAEDSAFRAEAIAAVYDGVNPVTADQLEAQPLARMTGVNGQVLRDTRGNPVIYIPPQEPGVRTLRDFVLRARFGHFNGLAGACQTEVRVAPPRNPTAARVAGEAGR